MVYALQPSFTGGEVSPSLRARVDLSKYGVSLASCLNMIVQGEGGAHNRQGTRYIEKAFGNAPSRLIPFSYSTIQNYVLEFSDQSVRVFKNRGLLLDSGDNPIVIPSPYLQAELWDIRFAQSADILTLTHPNHPVYELKRLAEDSWQLVSVVFGPLIDPPSNVQVTGTGNGSTDYSYVVTSYGEDGIEESSRSDVATVIDKPDTNWRNTVTWDAVAGAEYYHVYREVSGVFGYVGRATGTSFDDNNIQPDLTVTAPDTKLPFEEPGDYPTTVSYHKQRRVFGGTYNEPQTNWFTSVGAFYDFNTSTPSQDDDAIKIAMVGGTPTNQVNAIEHYVSFTDLLVFTSGAVWTITSGGEPLTPVSADVDPQSYRGSTNLRPLVIENTVIYLQVGNVVRDLGYKFESDSYAGNNLSILAKHLFENKTFVDWTYASAPDSIIWLVRTDGTLLGLTYLAEQQVFGWHRHETTNGKFKSVTSVMEDDEDIVYVCVEREVDGQTVYYIEHMDFHQDHDNPMAEDSFYVDSGLTYEGAPATIFSGLDHLEGEAVYALADGNVYDDLVVNNGQVEIDVAASKVHVGLPMLAEIETLNAEIGTQEGTMQGRVKNIPRVSLRVLDSRGFWIGPDRDSMVEAKWRTDEGYNEATKLFSGDMPVPCQNDMNSAGSFVVQQRDPLPLYVLAAMPEIEVGY